MPALRVLSKLVPAAAIASLLPVAVSNEIASAAGTVSLTAIGSAYSQDFDALSNVAGSTTNTLAINGWELTEAGGGARDNEQYAVDTGGSNAGDTYSYGAAAATDRALGGLQSGTLIPTFGAAFVNSTGATITSLDVNYVGEQWRIGNTAAARDDRLDFQYSVDATSLTTGVWTDVDKLDFTNPIKTAATAGALDGNNPANQSTVAGVVSGVSIASGATFWIRWSDVNATGADDGLAVDNFSITPQSDALPDLTVNDVSMTEGNSGTTSFVFIVGLSAPAGPGGVTFDIATADGAAQDGNPPGEDSDYLAQFLASQTIPAGESAYSFTVSVNGDPIDEPNETFLVNVSNVVGATLVDGQGVGTIENDDAPVQPLPGNVVVSEVYGGGGNSGATFTNDFIELFNRTPNTIRLDGWSVQYASAAGATWQVTPLSGSIGAGQHYLVQESAGAGGTTPLPTPQATGGILMSATAGKVALVQNSNALAGACPIGPSISDFVGYGSTANCFESSGPTPAPSNTTSAQRLADGATDTDNNSADFVVGAADPDSGADPAPTVVSTVPADGAANVTVGSNIGITFSEPVDVSGDWFTISCGTSGVHTATVSGAATTFTLDPDADFVGSEACTVTVVAAQVSDQDTNDPDDNMVADHTFTFLTEGPVCSQPFTPISAIQGSGLSAAITGTVSTEGVVVGDFEGADAASGFYIQDATGDGDTATSDGIFVFTGTANTVAVGDLVRVTAFARERFNQTTLNGSNSNTAAVPASNIVNCGTASVPATEVTLPFADSDFPERYEGMLVRMPQALVISEYFNYARFGEVVLALPLPGEPRPFTGTSIEEPGAAANARTLANSLRRITLDDAQSAENPPVLRHPNGMAFSLTNRFRGGDTVQNTVGVLGFDFNLYRIVPTGPADYTAANPRAASPEPVGGSIRVAAMNTLNFFVTQDALDDDNVDNPADNVCGGNANLDCRGGDLSQPSEFQRQRDKLLTALTGLDGDIIGLNELENTPNVEPPASITSGMPGYDYIHTGTIGTDAIKVGIIYRPAVVRPVGAFQILDSSDDPRFIDTKSRPSLAQTFEVKATGARFTVVVNHLKSKGSSCNDVGDPDRGDGQENCSGTRTKAAQALVDWLATDPTGSGDPDYLVMGDLNSYAMEDPIDAIKVGPDDLPGTSDDYTNLVAKFQGKFAYSYTFDGEAGYLDQALANTAMSSQVTGAADWHINSDEPNIFDYDTSFKPPAQQALYAVDPYRTSDHDALVVGLDLDAPPAVVNDSYNVNEDARLTVAAPGVLANDSDANHDTLTAIRVSDPVHGTLTLKADGSFTYVPAANFNGTDSFTYKANGGGDDSSVATVTITVRAVNDAPVARPDSATVAKNGSVVIPALANDSDVDGDTLSVIFHTQGLRGSVTYDATTRSFRYTPKNGFRGADIFGYVISDGHGGVAITAVTVVVR